jgi:hypothetical protein
VVSDDWMLVSGFWIGQYKLILMVQGHPRAWGLVFNLYQDELPKPLQKDSSRHEGGGF